MIAEPALVGVVESVRGDVDLLQPVGLTDRPAVRTIVPVSPHHSGVPTLTGQ